MRRAVTAFVVVLAACSNAGPETAPSTPAPSADSGSGASSDVGGTDSAPLEAGDAASSDAGDLADTGNDGGPDDSCAVSGAPAGVGCAVAWRRAARHRS